MGEKCVYIKKFIFKFICMYVYIQGLVNETKTLGNIVLEVSWLYLRSLLASLH